MTSGGVVRLVSGIPSIHATYPGKCIRHRFFRHPSNLRLPEELTSCHTTHVHDKPNMEVQVQWFPVYTALPTYLVLGSTTSN